MGVALFFMLSAYLLTKLWGSVAFNRINIATYLAHRAARVLPLFWLAVPVYVALYDETYWNGAVCAAAISCPWSLWTVPVELQFYIVFLILWCGIRAGRALQSLAWCFLTIAAIGIAMFAYDVDNIRFPMWAHFFFIGSVMALWLPVHPLRRQQMLLAVLAPLLFLVAIPGLRIENDLPAMENNLDPLVMASVTVLFGTSLRSKTLADRLEHPIARWAGRISFGVYVIHWPVLIIVQRAGMTGGLALMLYIAASIGLAVASARLVEEPAKRGINRIFRKLQYFFSARPAIRS